MAPLITFTGVAFNDCHSFFGTIQYPDQGTETAINCLVPRIAVGAADTQAQLVEAEYSTIKVASFAAALAMFPLCVNLGV